MTCLMTTIIAAFVTLSGVGVGLYFSPPWADEGTMRNCGVSCCEFAALNGIDSAESLCGKLSNIFFNPFTGEEQYIYEKCVASKFAEPVAGKARKVVNDVIGSLGCQDDGPGCCDKIEAYAKEQGLDLSFVRKVKPIIADSDCNSYNYGQDLFRALFELRRVVDKGTVFWNYFSGKEGCEWLERNSEYPLPFCEANKNVPGCDKYLKIYGKCKRKLEDAANNKGEL